MDDTPEVSPETGGARPWRRPALLLGTLIVPVLLATGSTALAERPGPPASVTQVLRLPTPTLDRAPTGSRTPPGTTPPAADEPSGTSASAPSIQGSAPEDGARAPEEGVLSRGPSVRTQPAPAPHVLSVPPGTDDDDDDDEADDDD